MTCERIESISSVDFSLKKHEPRGIACCNYLTGDMTLFLSNFELIFRECGEFSSEEELIEELVIHELLGLILDHGKYSDREIDFWHVIICRLDNQHLKEAKDCSCPIDCFWRTQCSDGNESI